MTGGVIWITGLPASGKTTLAEGLVDRSKARGVAVLWLDSDALRRVMTPNASYNRADRDAFYRTLGYLAELGASGGVWVVVSAVASQRAYRDGVRARVDRFVEVFLECSDEEVRRRDPKGLYQGADRGDIEHLPGAGAAYEPPHHPEVRVDTTEQSPTQTLEIVWNAVAERLL